MFKRQYQDAQLRNYPLEKPTTITHVNVTNQKTIDLLEGVKSGSGDMYNLFFNSPNGKYTRRILDDFGFVASHVRRNGDNIIVDIC